MSTEQHGTASMSKTNLANLTFKPIRGIRGKNLDGENAVTSTGAGLQEPAL
jgi:hypothetical protein